MVLRVAQTLGTLVFLCGLYKKKGSWSCEPRSTGQGWPHVPILQRGILRPGTGLDRLLNDGRHRACPSLSPSTIGTQEATSECG